MPITIDTRKKESILLFSVEYLSFFGQQLGNLVVAQRSGVKGESGEHEMMDDAIRSLGSC